jgi:sialic acid synthase SpsE
LPGPDHRASLEPQELAEMVKAVRIVEQSLGTGEKVVAEAERPNIEVARKSIVAARAIAAGEKFTEDNITVKRPGSGISPMQWDSVLGLEAKRAFAPDELIEL